MNTQPFSETGLIWVQDQLQSLKPTLMWKLGTKVLLRDINYSNQKLFADDTPLFSIA